MIMQMVGIDSFFFQMCPEDFLFEALEAYASEADCQLTVKKVRDE